MRTKPTDYELGDDVTDRANRRDQGIVVSVRLDPEEGQRLTAIAKKSDRTLSQIVRAALKDYIIRAETSSLFGGQVTIVTGGVLLSESLPLKKTFAPTTSFDIRPDIAPTGLPVAKPSNRMLTGKI
ncbi:MAG: ribbon-helix-helix protein, CopG family [Dehalococcoidia bacterium]